MPTAAGIDSSRVRPRLIRACSERMAAKPVQYGIDRGGAPAVNSAARYSMGMRNARSRRTGCRGLGVVAGVLDDVDDRDSGGMYHTIGRVRYSGCSGKATSYLLISAQTGSAARRRSSRGMPAVRPGDHRRVGGSRKTDRCAAYRSGSSGATRPPARGRRRRGRARCSAVGAALRRLLQVIAHQRTHPAPQRHVPAVQRLAQPVRGEREALHLPLGRADLADLEKRDDAEPPAQQLEPAVADLQSQSYDLGRLLQATLAGVRVRDGVAVSRQRVAEGGRIRDGPGHGDRLLAERPTALLRAEEDSDDSGEHTERDGLASA